VHDTFVIDRHYDAAPGRVYRAFADPDAKARWFGGPEEKKRSVDFREGGRETLISTLPDGREMAFYAGYTDIVPDERIVYTYEMTMGGERISVSVVTVEVRAAGGGTDLRITEQGVYLDGLDQPAMRRDGTEQLLDALGGTLGD
jgi:uncharacterized protein YndB with AHSA1/START domain